MSAQFRDFDALYRLGLRLGGEGKFAEAERLMGEAAALNPASANAHFARGYALQRLGHSAGAVQCFDAVLRLKPDFPEALLNRAAALFALRHYKEAAGDYGRLLALDPDYPYARGNLLFSNLHCCDWTNLETETCAIVHGLGEGKRVIAPFDAKALALTAEDELRAARIWVADQCPASQEPLWRGEIYRHDRIRLAYLADDLPSHPAGPLLAGIAAEHAREKFETIAISFGPMRATSLQARLKREFCRYVAIDGESDFEIATLLRRMDVDIAVDLMGFTQGCRPGIFAHRPAPVQVNYLGYPGTMGADYMDYLIADAMVVPPGNESFFSEKLVMLPETFFPGDCGIPAAAVTRADAGLPQTGFVFCAFNNVYKIAPTIFAIWMRLLKDVPGSVLWLTRTNETAVHNLSRAAEAHGVAPERLVFASFLEARQDHLARMALADLFLDTLAYNAHATANDALGSGVPVLTVPGAGFAGRVAASLLSALGLPELIASSLDAYEAQALALARDSAALAALKAKIARNIDTKPLFDTPRITRHLEDAFAAMHARARNGEAPASFAVAKRP